MADFGNNRQGYRKEFFEPRQRVIEKLSNAGVEAWQKTHPVHEITTGKVGTFKVIDVLTDEEVLLMWTLEKSLEKK